MMRGCPEARDFVLAMSALVAWGLLSGEAAGQGKPGRPEVNGIAAKVNGRVVTKNEVAITLVPRKAKLEERFPDGGPEFGRLMEEAHKDVLKELMDRILLIDQFDGPEIRIPEAAVRNEVLREIRDDYQGDEGKLREALKACRMTMDGYRSLVRERLLAGKIRLRLEKGR